MSDKPGLHHARPANSPGEPTTDVYQANKTLCSLPVKKIFFANKNKKDLKHIIGFYYE